MEFKTLQRKLIPNITLSIFQTGRSYGAEDWADPPTFALPLVVAVAVVSAARPDLMMSKIARFRIVPGNSKKKRSIT
jgi:hypothetical protein